MVTYISGVGHSTLDYIMCRRKDIAMFTNIKTVHEECGRQHKLVIGEMKLRGVKKSKTAFRP